MGKPVDPERRRVPAWRRYLRFWGDDSARDLDDELAFHLAARQEELIAAGHTPAQAAAAAEGRFGDLARVRAQCEAIDSQWGREHFIMLILHRLAADIGYAIRQLRRAPSLSVAAILCLALGVGANTAMFSVVNGVLFRPLPFHDPDRLVLVGEGQPRIGDENFGVISMPEYRDYQRLDGGTFASSAIYDSQTLGISGSGGAPEQVSALRASANLFAVLGVSPALGRAFTEVDADTAAPAVAMLSDALWRRRFNADPLVVGRIVDVEGRPTTVVGILPAVFGFPLPGVGGEPADLFVPVKFTAAVERLRANSFFTFLIARLAPGVTIEQARRDVGRIAAGLPVFHPGVYRPDWPTVADAFPLRDRSVRGVRSTLLILLGAVGLVLLVACINVSSLLLARAAARQREIAVRLALGASVSRLIQQVLAEAAVLVVCGSALGIALAVWIAHLIGASAPGDALHGYSIELDWRVLTVTASVAITATVAISLLPALSFGRRSLTPALHDSARGATAGAVRQSARRILVVTQIALALLLSAGAGLMLRSLQRVYAVDTGFDAAQLVTFRVGLPTARYGTATSVVQVEQRVLDALRALPGVVAASATNHPPLIGPSRITFSVEGAALDHVPLGAQELVYPDYFRTMGVRVREGRVFSASDVRGSLPVVIVNETLARKYVDDGGALGRRLKWGSPASPNPWLTIVGVTADVRQQGVDEPPDPEIYFPAIQQDSATVDGFLRGMSFMARGSGDLNTLMRSVKRTVRQIDPELPIIRLQRMTDVIGGSTAPRAFNTLLLASFACLALVLASVGIYGLIAFSVVQRTREIGVRLAIGAVPGDVVRLVLGQGARIALTGVVIGLAGTIAATRVMESLLFETSAVDAATLGGSAIVLMTVALLASWIPARRAAQIDPQSAIRAE